MKHTIRLAAAAAMLLVVGCGPSAEILRDGPLLSDDGPFIDEDQEGLLVSAAWISEPGETPPLDDFSPTAAALLPDRSRPGNLRAAVNGGGCRPHVVVSVVRGPPEVELLLEIGPPVRNDNVQCPELLKAHEFELVLSQGVVVRDVTVTPISGPSVGPDR